jgi:hypothetical protein
MHQQKFSSTFRPQKMPTVHKVKGLYEKKGISSVILKHTGIQKTDRTSLLLLFE